MRFSYVVIAFLATAAIGGDLLADPLAPPSTDAEKRCLEAGNRYYLVRDFDRAIGQYKKCAIASNLPIFQYNLAQAYRVSGRYQEAIWHYERFLASANPNPEVLAAVNGFIQQMTEELNQQASRQPPTEVARAGRPLHLRTSEKSEPWYADRAGWALSIGGGMLAITSAYLFANAWSIDSEARNEHQDSERLKLRETASNRRTLGVATGVLGLVAFSVGVGKLIVSAPQPRGSNGMQLVAVFETTY